MTRWCLYPSFRWPERDQQAWEDGLGLRGDRFARAVGRRNWADATIEKTAKAYGRWLTFLAANGQLDEVTEPADRVTPERLIYYFRDLKAHGNADHTIIARFADLERALKVIARGRDWAWVRRPFGHTLYSMLPKTRRPMIVPSSPVLFEWGCSMMELAAAQLPSRRALSAYRDGLFIAMLATRARRLRAMAGLRVGHELVRTETSYRLVLPASLVKTRRSDRVSFPKELTPWVDRYLREVRPDLLRGAHSEMVWISAAGRVMSEKSLAARIEVLSKRRFDTSFGPHRFRHALVTTSSTELPDAPWVGSALLGISPGVAEGAYNLAEQAAAASKFDEILEQRRERWEGWAPPKD